MVSPTGRPVLNVALDEQTHDRFLRFCEVEGITAAALVEAFARMVVSDSPPIRLPELIVDAREIAAERRRRR